MKLTSAVLTLLVFGAIALVGLIVLAAVHSLPAGVETVLSSIAFGSLAGGAGVAVPGQSTVTTVTPTVAALPAVGSPFVPPAA